VDLGELLTRGEPQVVDRLANGDVSACHSAERRQLRAPASADRQSLEAIDVRIGHT
jgi:hypothetical protein